MVRRGRTRRARADSGDDEHPRDLRGRARRGRNAHRLPPAAALLPQRSRGGLDMSLPARQQFGTSAPALRRQGESLADVLERVLDKGVVIAGDVAVNVLDIELLTLKV